LILDFEKGAWGIPDKFQKAHRVTLLNNHEVLDKVVEQLIKDAPKRNRPYDHVVFDTIDAFAEMSAKELARRMWNTPGSTWRGDDIRQWGQKGAGYSRLTNHCWASIQALETAGYTWTAVGHIKEETVHVNGKDITVTRPVLFNMLSSILSRNADVVSMIEATTVQVPRYKTIQGSGKKIEVGVEEVKRIQFNAAVQEVGIGSGTGKLRGVANLDMTFLLPDFTEGCTGWEKFVAEYNGATEKVRQGQFA